MSAWCAKVVCLILLAEAFQRIPGSTGLDGLHVDTVREFLPTSVAPGNQAHAFTSAGSSWQLYKRCSTFVYVASATGILLLRILLCRGEW